MIEYQKILDKNMLNVFKDILKNIKENGLSNNNHLYVTFLTNHKHVELPNWLKQKYPQEMTIIIQYEYYDLEINKNNFSITLSFDDIKTNLKINYNAIVSFADPSANFGLILQKSKIQKKVNKKLETNILKKDNVINFSKYKKINLSSNAQLIYHFGNLNIMDYQLEVLLKIFLQVYTYQL